MIQISAWYIRRTPSHTFQDHSGKEILGNRDMGEVEERVVPGTIYLVDKDTLMKKRQSHC
jgi:hypothetical protein